MLFIDTVWNLHSREVNYLKFYESHLVCNLQNTKQQPQNIYCCKIVFATRGGADLTSNKSSFQSVPGIRYWCDPGQVSVISIGEWRITNSSHLQGVSLGWNKDASCSSWYSTHCISGPYLDMSRNKAIKPDIYQ